MAEGAELGRVATGGQDQLLGLDGALAAVKVESAVLVNGPDRALLEERNVGRQRPGKAPHHGGRLHQGGAAGPEGRGVVGGASDARALGILEPAELGADPRMRLGELSYLPLAVRPGSDIEPAPFAPIALNLLLGDQPAELVDAGLKHFRIALFGADVAATTGAVRAVVQHEARVPARRAEADPDGVDEQYSVVRPVLGELLGDGEARDAGADDRPMPPFPTLDPACRRRHRQQVVPATIGRLRRQVPWSYG